MKSAKARGIAKSIGHGGAKQASIQHPAALKRTILTQTFLHYYRHTG
jgi:hypothetical protein